jgi:D-aminopeptidase
MQPKLFRNRTSSSIKTLLVFVACFVQLGVPVASQTPDAAVRPRARDLGLKIGVLPTGALNAITDVPGVTVGHTTLIKGDNIRTGVTAIVPHGGNLFQEKVPGAVYVGNGFGKLMGSTQVNELGEIETPIFLTSTLSVPRTADFLLDYMLALPGNENVQSINALVAETNDGFLNDIRGRHIIREDVFAAIKNARSGAVEEGSVGAGTGTVAFGWKGGIGTSSRKLPASLGGYTIGILVQSNFGGVLSIDGAPVGIELGNYYLRNARRENHPAGEAPAPLLRKEGSSGVSAGPFNETNPKSAIPNPQSPDGSIIIVVATDAPLDHRQLRRLAERTMSGLARTGSSMTNGSGDYAIAFSTGNRINSNDKLRNVQVVGNDSMSPLFQAVIESTEEAILNSMFKATTMTGKEKRTIEALPIERVKEILKKYRRVN